MGTYLVVDLEMTGLSPSKDRILEIGAVYIRDGKIAETFERLINPQRKLEERIVELTGITDDLVADAKTEIEVMDEFLAFAQDTTLVGHNINFDYSFLKQSAINRGLSYDRNGLDTLKIARRVLKDTEPKGLEALCERFRICREHQHRALDDALATAEIFLLLKNQYEDVAADAFAPVPLFYKAKKQGPATPAQKRDLKHLCDYHKIEPEVAIESMTKSEASRMIDRIYAEYGRAPKE